MNKTEMTNKYITLKLFTFYGSQLVSTLRHHQEKNFLFCLVWFDGISTIVGYLMPNTLYTYILNIYDLVGLGFMANQLL